MSTVPVNSSQSGSFTLTGASNTVTITSVVTAQSVLFFTVRGGDNTPGNSLVRGELTNSTTLTFDRVGTTNDPVIHWQVVEFDSTVSVQRGTMTNVGSSAPTTTITAVDLSRSVVISGGQENGGSTTGTDDSARLRLVNTTTLEADAGGNSVDEVNWQVVEFPSAAISSINYYSGGLSGTTTDVTVTSVDTAKSLLFGTNYYTATTTFRYAPSIELTSGTNLRLTKNSATNAVQYGIFVVEFADYDVTHGTAAWTTNLTETEVLGSAPSHGTALVNGIGAPPGLTGTSDSDDDYSEALWSASLSGSTWTFTRTANTRTSYLSYSIIDWGQTVGGGDTLLADDVQSTSEVSSPSLGQEHGLLAVSIQSTSEIGSPSLGQEHVITVTSVQSTSEVSSPVLSESHILTVTNTESVSEVSSPVLGQQHSLTATSVNSSSENTAPTLSQTHALVVTSVETATEVSAPTLAEAIGDVLLAEDVESSSEISSPTLGQEHNILSTGVESVPETTVPTIGQEHSLLVANVQSVSSVSSPALVDLGSVIGGVYNAAGSFTSGQNDVVIELFNPVTGSSISLDSNVCVEIGSSGVYVWDTSKLTTQPTGYQEYIWKMSDGSITGSGVISVFDSEDSTKLLEIWQRLGLDSTNPLTNKSDGGYTVDAIDVQATQSGDDIVQTRQ